MADPTVNHKLHTELFKKVRDRVPVYGFDYVSYWARVSQTTLHNWVNGKVKSPQTRTLCDVAQVVGLEITIKEA